MSHLRYVRPQTYRHLWREFNDDQSLIPVKLLILLLLALLVAVT